jgi:hypothetical protein
MPSHVSIQTVYPRHRGVGRDGNTSPKVRKSHYMAVIFTHDLALAPTTLQVDRKPCGVNFAENERRAFCSGRR